MKVAEHIKITLAIVFWLVLFAGAVITLYQTFKPTPEVSSTSTRLEDRCEFVVKTTDFRTVTFSEPTAGTFNYELYATTDGYVEVWKCNK